MGRRRLSERVHDIYGFYADAPGPASTARPAACAMPSAVTLLSPALLSECISGKDDLHVHDGMRRSFVFSAR